MWQSGGLIVIFCTLSFYIFFAFFNLQIGCRFWDLALREHAQYNKVAGETAPPSTFSLSSLSLSPLSLPLSSPSLSSSSFLFLFPLPPSLLSLSPFPLSSPSLPSKSSGTGGAKGALAPPIFDLHTRMLRADNRLLRSLSHKPPPPDHISVPPLLLLSSHDHLASLFSLGWYL